MTMINGDPTNPSPSVLDRINRLNRLIRIMRNDLASMSAEVTGLAGMFGIVVPSEDTGDHGPYQQDVPYFTPRSVPLPDPLTDPLFSPREIGVATSRQPVRLEVDPDRFLPAEPAQSDGMPHADRN
jgi:hypothetical protein